MKRIGIKTRQNWLAGKMRIDLCESSPRPGKGKIVDFVQGGFANFI